MTWCTVKLSILVHLKQNKHLEFGLSMISKRLINWVGELMDRYFWFDKGKANLYVY